MHKLGRLFWSASRPGSQHFGKRAGLGISGNFAPAIVIQKPGWIVIAIPIQLGLEESQ